MAYAGYRDYLNQIGDQGNAQAKNLLNYVGNDANFGDISYLPSAYQQLYRSQNQALYDKYQQAIAPPAYQPYGGGGGAPRVVYAPKLDIAAVNAQARSAAENAVNPYYTKQLNEFLAQKAAKQQNQQTQYETNIKNLEDQLKQQLEQNDITKQRTTEDVAQNEAEIAKTASEFQTDTGQQFDTARLALARQTAGRGGLGAQQVESAQTQRNLGETRQVQKFQEAKQQQELFKSRTIDDLIRSGERAKEGKEKGTKQAKFDLDTYIQNLGFEEQGTRNELEQQRLSRIAQEQQNQAKLRFNNYIAGIANPAQRLAAMQTYGGSFG